MQDYRTVKGESQDEFVERKSRFIGVSKHVETGEEAMAFVAAIKEQHRDATHNVFAYALKDGQTRRYSDDGEPQGTAGIPVLDVILKEGIVDVCVVVTRYFGGILLGGGGLVRAYSQGCRLALGSAQRCSMTLCVILEASFAYSLYGKISYILPKYEVRVLSSDFGELVQLVLMLSKSKADSFLKEWTELTGGAFIPHVTEEKYAEMS
ncbi:MAG: YigZ family protein [Oscillospiraceae bacterium]